MNTARILDFPQTTAPTFDMHRVEASLLTNHKLFNGIALSEQEVADGVAQYLAFLQRHKEAGMPTDFEKPSQIVDRVWHTHMCETRQYASDCNSYFGQMFHHSNDTCDMKVK